VRRNSVLVLKLILKVDVAMVVRALLHTTTMRINYHRQRGSTTGRLDYKRAIIVRVIVRGNSVPSTRTHTHDSGRCHG
jgi:hypothetical protein